MRKERRAFKRAVFLFSGKTARADNRAAGSGERAGSVAKGAGRKPGAQAARRKIAETASEGAARGAFFTVGYPEIVIFATNSGFCTDFYVRARIYKRRAV